MGQPGANRAIPMMSVQPYHGGLFCDCRLRNRRNGSRPVYQRIFSVTVTVAPECNGTVGARSLSHGQAGKTAFEHGQSPQIRTLISPLRLCERLSRTLRTTLVQDADSNPTAAMPVNGTIRSKRRRAVSGLCQISLYAESGDSILCAVAASRRGHRRTAQLQVCLARLRGRWQCKLSVDETARPGLYPVDRTESDAHSLARRRGLREPRQAANLAGGC